MRSAMRPTSLLAAILLAASLSIVPSAVAGPEPVGQIRTTLRPIFGLDAELDALFTTGGLTAEAAAQRARAASPRVHAARAQVMGAAAGVGRARIERLPQVTVSAGYTRLSDVDSPPILLGGAAFSFPVLVDQWRAGVELRVPISDHLLRYPHTTAAASHGVGAARLATTSAADDAARDARLAFHEWTRARLQVIVAERLVTQIEANLDVIIRRAAAEDASKADVLRMQAQAAEAAQQVVALRNLAAQRELVLRRLIDARDDEPLVLGEDIRNEAVTAVPGDVAGWVAHARNARPELLAIDERIAAAAARKRAAAATRLPRLDGHARLDHDNPNQRFMPAQDRFETSWAAGVVLSWSLDGALAATPAMFEQDAEILRLRAEREAAADGFELAVMEAVRAIEVARVSHRTSDDGLRAAEESYRVRRALFAAGRATSVELIDAETELTRARIAAVDARVDLRVGVTHLRHAIGI